MLITPTGFRLRLAVIFIRSGVRIGILAAVFVVGIFRIIIGGILVRRSSLSLLDIDPV